MYEQWIYNIYDTILFSMKTKVLVIAPEDYATDEAVEGLIIDLKQKGIAIRKTVDLLNKKGIKYKGKHLYYSAIQRVLKTAFDLKQAEKAKAEAQPIEANEQATPNQDDAANQASEEVETAAVKEESGVEVKKVDTETAAVNQEEVASTEIGEEMKETEASEENIEESATSSKRTIRKHPRTGRELRNYMNQRRR